MNTNTRKTHTCDDDCRSNGCTMNRPRQEDIAARGVHGAARMVRSETRRRYAVEPKPMAEAEDAAGQAHIKAALEYLETKVQRGEEFTGPGMAANYAKLKLGNLAAEQFCVAFLDARNRLIAWETLFHGTVGQTAVHPREVVRRTLHHNAVSILLFHNHPSGDPTPSIPDLKMTRGLVKALRAIDVDVLDHIIVGGGKSLSMSEEGCLDGDRVSTEDPMPEFLKLILGS